MTAPFWIDPTVGNASLWDFLWLGGVLWPGICTIDVSKSRAIDPAKEKGKDGVTLTDNGYDASTFKAILQVWTEEQWNDLNEIIPNFDPRRPGSSRTPLDIYHPAAELLGIKTVYLRAIKCSTPVEKILRVDLDLIEWFPETKTAKGNNKPKGFDGTKKSGAPLNSNDFAVDQPSSNTGSKL